MKKILTLLTLTLVLTYAGNAFAQSATTTAEEKAALQTAPDNSPATQVAVPVTVERKSTLAPQQARPVQTTTDKNAHVRQEIAAFENKINANRNNPDFDVKAAEAELQRMKQAAGVK